MTGLTNLKTAEGREVAFLLGPAVVLLGFAFFIPLLGLLSMSFLNPEPTIVHYQEFLSNWANWVILGRTFVLATVVTGICLVLGYPFAYLIISARPWIAALLLFAVVVPFFTSYLVRTYAWMVLLGRFGLINQLLMAVGLTERPLNLIYNQFSVFIAMIYILLPYTVMILASVMRGIPHSLLRASSSLGAPGAQTFWRIFFPLSAPGVVAAGLLVFVFALGFYITPALLGGPGDTTLPMLIDSHVNGSLNWPLAAAAATVLLVITLALYTLSNRLVGTEDLLGSQAGAAKRVAKKARSTNTYIHFIDAVTKVMRLAGRLVPRVLSALWQHLHVSRILISGTGVLVTIFLLSPILIIVPISFSSSRFLDFPPPGFSLQWYEAYFTSSSWVSATVQSIVVGIGTAFVSLTIGTAAAMALVRGSARLRRIGYQLLLAPMIVPTIVSSVALYFLFADLRLVNTSLGLVLAHSIGATPLVALIAASSLQSQDRRLEQAAASLGASRPTAIRLIVLPLIRPTLIVAGFFAFLHSFDEVVLSLFISGANTTTLPVKMWSGVREDITPTIAAVSSILIGLTVLFYLTMEIARHRKARAKKA